MLASGDCQALFHDRVTVILALFIYLNFLGCEETLDKRLLLREVLCSVRRDLSLVLFNNEIDNLLVVVIEDVVCTVPKLLLILIMCVRLISDFVIFHDHLSNSQVQDKERANNNAGDKVDDREALRPSFLVKVHHWCPPIHSHDLENCDQSKTDVVEIVQSPE